MKRVKDVNTSVSEQVFSWFRGYARTFSEMKSLRQRFLVLYYSVRHNALIDAGKTSHLNGFAIGQHRVKKKQQPYGCGPTRKQVVTAEPNGSIVRRSGDVKVLKKPSYVDATKKRNRAIAMRAASVKILKKPSCVKKLA